ncbi:MAG TPA: thioredoxin domain-containing protein [Bryobacteraceae bacterium]|jgi:protein-disulfide isomerase|nr:thioredoxin domain-containing protein [Bryobacteraceae bacterium]
MRSFLRRSALAAGAYFVATALVMGQQWKTASSLPGVDLSHLTAAQQQLVLKVLREQGCSCGCGMKLAECRVVDPSCSYSTGMAAAVVDAVSHGKTEEEAKTAATNSKWGHIQGEQPQKLLEDPVSIPTAGAPSIGPENAPITLVEFSDFQCPYCAAATPELSSVLKAYPTQVRLIFKEYPLDTHSQAHLAATAAVAAQKQGKFWPMYDMMFAHHDELSRANIFAYARQSGLDMKRFEADIDSTAVNEFIVRDVQDGDHLGVEGTPTLFINGRRYNGPISVQALKSVFDSQFKPAAANVAQAQIH